MRWLISLLLIAGTLLATLGFARTDPREPGWQRKTQVNWPLALGGLTLMGVAVVGKIVARRVRPSVLEQDLHAGEEIALQRVRSWIEELVAGADQLRQMELDNEKLHVWTARIESLVHGPMAQLFAHRYALASRYGGAILSHVVAPVSEAERWLNRAWAAAVDGYFEAARAAAETAYGRLCEVQEQVQALG